MFTKLVSVLPATDDNTMAIFTLFNLLAWQRTGAENTYNFFYLNFVLVLGGWGNTRAVVRKRIENYALKDLTLSSVISAVRPLKVIIEMSQGNELLRNMVVRVFYWKNSLFIDGHINVFTDDNPEPLIRAYDPLPLPIKYVSFASHHSASVEFLYNCVSDKTGVLSPNAIQKEPWHGQANSLSEVPVEGEYSVKVLSINFL